MPFTSNEEIIVCILSVAGFNKSVKERLFLKISCKYLVHRHNFLRTDDKYYKKENNI